MWNLKYDINELICEQKQTYRQREQACDYQGGGEPTNTKGYSLDRKRKNGV